MQRSVSVHETVTIFPLKERTFIKNQFASNIGRERSLYDVKIHNGED
jgi:hypothetical protein